MVRLYATKVSDRVYLLDTFAVGQEETVAAYLIKGQKPALVDCGYASSHQSVLLGLSEVGVKPSDVRYLIPTHVHLDHAGAAGHLLREMPNAEVIAHERGVPHLVDPSRLIESATRVFGEAIMALYGRPIPIPPDRVTAVGEESSLDLGDGISASLVHTPGHAPHQISAMIEGTGALLTADAVGITYPNLKTLIPTTPPPSFDPALLASSVDSLRRMSPKQLLVPHYGVKNDPDQVFADTNRKVPEWVETVRSMIKRGMVLDDISEKMSEKVAAESGTSDLPIYAKVSVRASVMGIIHYLSKNP
ncbi:MAG: MBL fold metallo-hydrolase [Thaumarchaeota archaeon]|nr:MBL fold metallo-hydrolase [Nitrososphaerota archaeon]